MVKSRRLPRSPIYPEFTGETSRHWRRMHPVSTCANNVVKLMLISCDNSTRPIVMDGTTRFPTLDLDKYSAICWPRCEMILSSPDVPSRHCAGGCDPKMGLRCISLRVLICGYVRHLLVVRIAQNAVDFSVFKGVGSQILGDRRLA